MNDDSGHGRRETYVRDATDADWPAIWEIVEPIVRAGETFTYATDLTERAARAQWAAGPASCVLVAVDGDGAVRGTAHVHRNREGPGAHVASASFMVHLAYEGRGAGRALVLTALDWARREGYRAMQFNAVAASNVRAIGLYQSLGFAIVGTVPEAFLHPTEGFVGLHVMWRAL